RRCRRRGHDLRARALQRSTVDESRQHRVREVMRPLVPRLVLAVGVAGAGALELAACGSEDYVVVTVDARPGVRSPRALSVSLFNGGTMRVDSLPLAERAFPVTFSISGPGRTGELAIAIDATDAS